MEAKIRRVVVCGSCGGHITLYDLNCPYCRNLLEPFGDVRHILPHVTNNPYAAKDAESLKPHLEALKNFWSFRPITIDKVVGSLTPLRDHRYPYREYIIDTLACLAHFRSICMDSTAETRETHLEIYKRLDAIYNSLTGNSVY